MATLDNLYFQADCIIEKAIEDIMSFDCKKEDHIKILTHIQEIVEDKIEEIKEET